ncbi:MAG: ABC transporter permease [Spirochaetes bacterium]|nr:ABC transporter permease [Spirochaetota bacterium]
MNLIKIIFLKELKEIFRDRRTVILSVIIPLILFPMIFFFMNTNSKADRNRQREYRISCEKISSDIMEILNANEKITVISLPDSSDSLKNGNLDAILAFEDGTYFIKYDNTNTRSIITAEFIQTILQNIYSGGLPADSKVKIIKSSVYNESLAAGFIMLSIMLPTLLFLFSASTPMATAADLSSGEKERFTLEPLISNPVNYSCFVAGKIIAVSVTGVIGVLSFMTGVFISYKLTPEFFSPDTLEFALSATSILLIILSALFLVIIASTVELTIGIFAKSIKEAQIYYLPVLLINSAIGYGTMIVNPYDVPDFYRFIPLYNISVLIKQFSMNIINTEWVIITFVQASFYIAAVSFTAVYLFRHEKILFRV